MFVRPRFLIFAALVSAMLPLQAQAQSQQKFTGLRIQAHAGYDNLTASAPGVERESIDSGVNYGGVIGYDFISAIWVIGIEAYGEKAAIDRTEMDGATTARFTTGRDLGAGLRIGLPISSNILAFARGGYSNIQTDVEFTGGLVAEASETLNGWRIGGGLEVYLSKSFFVSAEYRFTDYEGSLIRHNAIGSIGFRF
ncbi:MAG: porin family protein [Pseudomonadota bacterium]